VQFVGRGGVVPLILNLQIRDINHKALMKYIKFVSNIAVKVFFDSLFFGVAKNMSDGTETSVHVRLYGVILH
jgi:hypothetical protein